MKLYLVTDTKGGYDQLASAAIYADTEDEAKFIFLDHPNSRGKATGLEVETVARKKGIVHEDIAWG